MQREEAEEATRATSSWRGGARARGGEGAQEAVGPPHRRDLSGDVLERTTIFTSAFNIKLRRKPKDRYVP